MDVLLEFSLENSSSGLTANQTQSDNTVQALVSISIRDTGTTDLLDGLSPTKQA